MSVDPINAAQLSGAHLHSVGFHATDLHATTAFYRLLGLVVPEPGDAPAAAATVTGPTGTDLTMTWATAAVLEQLDPARVGDPALRVQIEIGYDEPADVDDAWRTATGAGHPGVAEPFDAPWGVRLSVLSDPDGNRVACTAPLTRTTAERES